MHSITQTPQVWIDHTVFEVQGRLQFNWDSIDELFGEGLVAEMFAAYCPLLDRLADPAAWQATVDALLPQARLQPAARPQPAAAAAAAAARAVRPPGEPAAGRGRGAGPGPAAELRRARPRGAAAGRPAAGRRGAARRAGGGEHAARLAAGRRHPGRAVRRRRLPADRPGAAGRADRAPAGADRGPAGAGATGRQAGDLPAGVCPAGGRRGQLRSRRAGLAAGRPGGGGPGLRDLHLRIDRHPEGGDDRPPGRGEHPARHQLPLRRRGRPTGCWRCRR